MKKTAAVLAAMCLLSACATVTRGTKQSWEVNSVPEGARVELSNGRGCAITPCGIRVPRHSDFVATFSKTGYRPTRINVTHTFASGGGWAIAGNVLLCCGLLGVAVDAVDGADFNVSPNPVVVKLERDAVVAPPPPTAPPEPLPEPRRYQRPVHQSPD